jgi:transposase
MPQPEEDAMKESKASPPKRRKRREPSLPPSLRQVNLHAAGIDIGASGHHVAVPPGSDAEGRDVREFGAFTADLHHLADWLEECGARTVAMESTGVYWIPLYDLLESRGFDVSLVDPRRLTRVPGRKTDILDCQWIQQLHTYGLLAGSFRPKEQVCTLRAYTREREMLVAAASQPVQHIQKALSQMNMKLQHVIGDVMGVTGSKIIRAVLDGERDPMVLAKMRDRRCKNSEETIAKSLEGTWRDEHIFQLRLAVARFDFIHGQIAECDRAIEACLGTFEDRSGGGDIPAAPGKGRKPARNQPKFDLRSHLYRMTGVDLTRIEGIEAHTGLKIISEIGVDVSPWPSVKHFASWLGLCPGSKKSGGKQMSGRSKQCASRVAAALRLAAYSLHHSHSALGAFLRRMAARLDMPRAITATAHKLARLVYAMLKNGTDYVARGQEEYEKQHEERAVRNLKKAARRFGFNLVKSNDLPDATQLPPLCPNGVVS